MRRPLALLAALLISASPSLAQQTADVAAAPATAPSSAPAQAPAEKPAAPSLHVSDAEIRERLRETDEKKGQSDRAEARQVGSYNFLYIVAAVAIGVIVAAVILD